MNKTIIWGVVAIIIVGGVSFFAGMSYGKGQQSSTTRTASGQFAGRGSFAGGAGARGGFTAGQIVAASNGSISIQSPTSSSTEIVLVSGSTQILKSVQGSQSDLTVGESVVVTGSANSDGSLTAQAIQIRPAGMVGGFGSSGRTQ